MTLSPVNLVFALTYKIPKRIFIRCDLDRVDVLNTCLRKATLTICWFAVLRFILQSCMDEPLFSSPGSRGQILSPNLDAVSVRNNDVLIFLEAR